ncbi:MAG: NTP transferase domain-containing protein [Myxococcales bacterium]|nr:NTP transferase domain-containing protein [Myxococcales bacterium]
MGAPKALAVLDGETFVAGLVRRLLAGGCATVTVVVGADAERVRAAVPAPGRVVVAADWARGMRASLRAGVAACPPGDLLLTHVDRPRVAPATLARLRAAAPGRAVIPTFEGRGGHPVRLPAGLRPRLLQDDDAPLRTLLGDALRLPVDDADVRLNLNTPEALAALGGWLPGGGPT